VSADIEDLKETLKVVKETHEEAELFKYNDDIFGMLNLAPKIAELDNY